MKLNIYDIQYLHRYLNSINVVPKVGLEVEVVMHKHTTTGHYRKDSIIRVKAVFDFEEGGDPNIPGWLYEMEAKQSVIVEGSAEVQ